MNSKLNWNICGVIFDIDDREKRLAEIESIIAKDGFWDNPEDSKSILKERTSIANKLDQFNKLWHDLEENQIPIKEFQQTGLAGDKGYKCSFIVSTTNVYDWEKVKATLEDKLREGIYINESLGTISIIGEGFSRNSKVLLETFRLLQKNNINFYGVNTTSFRISILIERDLVEDAVKACHDYWIK